MRKTLATALLSVSLGLVAAGARAQSASPPVPAGGPAASGPEQKGKLVIGPEEAGRKPGLVPGALVGATFNFADNRSVVGQPDGSSVTLGGAIDATLDANEGPHEWRNALGVGAGVTQTPAIDELIKTRDTLGVETIYLYHVVPSLGPFLRVGMNTAMFSGYDIRAAAATYAIAHADGTTETLGGRRLRLTDPFQPLTLKETLGAFAQPVTTDRVRLEIRVGAGAQEVFADEALAVNDDAATPEVEVKELESFNQMGIEGVANAWGTIDEDKRVAYTVGIGVLVPLAYSELPPGDDRGALDLTNVELTAGLSVKLVEWASLDYKLAVLRQPQLVDATQVTNNLLLTIGVGLGSKAPAPPPPPPACPEPAPAPPAPAATPVAPAPPPPPPPPPPPAAPEPPPPPAPPPAPPP